MGISVNRTFNFVGEVPVGVPVTNIPLSAEWRNDGPNAPEAATENGDLVYLFDQGLAQNLTVFVKVPQTYVPGKQLLLYGSFYSASILNTVLFQTSCYLIRQNIDPLSFTTNVRVSTNAAYTNPLNTNVYSQVTFDLSSATGTINSTSITPGDLLKIVLQRASDTDSATVRFVPNSTEITYAT